MNKDALSNCIDDFFDPQTNYILFLAFFVRFISIPFPLVSLSVFNELSLYAKLIEVRSLRILFLRIQTFASTLLETKLLKIDNLLTSG